jgi:methylmalonyl-CoA/ethylmalonyl-CoA epimerase
VVTSDDVSSAAPILESVGAVFDHVAHAVPSIRALLPLYCDILGAVPYSAGINPYAGHLAVQFALPGGKLELLEPTTASSESVGAFLRKSPRGGLHHITLRVPDLDETFATVQQAGYTPVGVRLEPSPWREIFLHPTQTGGILIQLVEADPDMPPPLTESLDDLFDQAEALRRAEKPPF